MQESQAPSLPLPQRPRPGRPFISEPRLQACWLRALSLLLGCWPGDPGPASSPFMASFFHLQNAGSYCLRHPVGAGSSRDSAVQAYLAPAPSLSEKDKEKNSP